MIAGQARINDIRDLEIEDLLGRDPVRPDNAQVASSLFGRSVMVTGAGGSIGSEFALYAIERELQQINAVEGLSVCSSVAGQCGASPPLRSGNAFIWGANGVPRCCVQTRAAGRAQCN